ncbi:exocyst complex component 4-like [Penaeus japonicus]|uniref:exocyst complex component 4-like n=1 Tax=Penaeus japonicus TaxID=27405 RepID=UPI001C711726|nr:exocyst complex component 4-like [Penaeus japonicus]
MSSFKIKQVESDLFGASIISYGVAVLVHACTCLQRVRVCFQARQYYEMLYHTPEEILNAIMNRGKQFSELEYINALQLLHRSSPGTSQEVLHSHLQRLSEILGDIGVTV